MNGSMKVLVVALAGIFALLFVVTTALAFALYSVEQSAFDADLYKGALAEERVYQRLSELTAQALAVAAQWSGRNDLFSLFRDLSEEEWQRFVFELFPSQVLRDLAEDAITQVMAYLNGESDQAVLTLTGLKAHLGSPEGVNAVYGMLKAQPDCSMEQLTAMALNQQALILCNPPETFLSFDLRPVYEAGINAAVVAIPEQVILISARANRLEELQNLRNLRMSMRLSPLLPMLCLLVITVLAVRSLRDWLNWWGYPLLLAGLVSLSLPAVSQPLAAWAFQAFVAPALSKALPADFVVVSKDLFASIIHLAVQPALLAAGIIALVGLIMVALPFLLRKKFQNNHV